MSLGAVMKAAAEMPLDPGWDRPPDAGCSVLGTFGFNNHLIPWLLGRAPELLALTPRQLVEGLKPKPCPGDCYRPMVLRRTEAAGRMPERYVWKCFRHSPHVVRELDPPVFDRPKDFSLSDMIDATRRGATLEYQPSQYSGKMEATIVEPKRKRRKR